MNIFVAIAHYFKQAPVEQWDHSLGSARHPVSRIAALNSAMIALHRYFGPALKTNSAPTASAQHALDIVILTTRNENLLDKIGIDPSTYSVEYFDGPPLMLGFEAQRLMRDRRDLYDIYVYLEDDHTIVDPEFFAKIRWFVQTFGDHAMLMPTRYEMSHSGTPAKIEFSPRLSSRETSLLPQAVLPQTLSGEWHGAEQVFRRPNNPHTGCFVVTNEQLDRWIDLPCFYDKDASFIDPLVSAATLAPLKAFSVYRAAEPDPLFLSIEHFGTRYASAMASDGEHFGEPPWIALAESGFGKETSFETINSMFSRARRAETDLERLQNSRSKLTRALVKSIWNRRKPKVHPPTS